MTDKEKIKRHRLQLEGMLNWPDDAATDKMRGWVLKKIEGLMNKLHVRNDTMRKAYRMNAKFDARRAMKAPEPRYEYSVVQGITARNDRSSVNYSQRNSQAALALKFAKRKSVAL